MRLLALFLEDIIFVNLSDICGIELHLLKSHSFLVRLHRYGCISGGLRTSELNRGEGHFAFRLDRDLHLVVKMDTHPVLSFAKDRVLTVTIPGRGIYSSVHVRISSGFLLAERLAIDLFGIRVAQPVAH